MAHHPDARHAIAFRDPPLLNAVGIHEPYALRSIVELETNDGLVGIAETYGDEGMLKALAAARELIEAFRRLTSTAWTSASSTASRPPRAPASR